MKVKELIEDLQKHDPDCDVVIQMAPKGQIIIFEIDGIYIDNDIDYGMRTVLEVNL